VLVPPASFLIKDSDVLILLGKEQDISKIKELKSES
jgi:trk system potassium uptake protein TrkA